MGDVTPDFGAVSGAGQLAQVAGALMTIVLVVAVLMLIVSAVGWAISNSTGNWQGAQRGRVGVFVSVATAAVCGAGITWANFLLATGEHL